MTRPIDDVNTIVSAPPALRTPAIPRESGAPPETTAPASVRTIGLTGYPADTVHTPEVTGPAGRVYWDTAGPAVLATQKVSSSWNQMEPMPAPPVIVKSESELAYTPTGVLVDDAAPRKANDVARIS